MQRLAPLAWRALAFLLGVALVLFGTRLMPITVWPDTWSPLFGAATNLVFIDDDAICYRYRAVSAGDCGCADAPTSSRL